MKKETNETQKPKNDSQPLKNITPANEKSWKLADRKGQRHANPFSRKPIKK